MMRLSPVRLSPVRFMRALLSCAVFFLMGREALALDAVSLYLGSNQVETGVILSVSKRDVWLLSLEGVVKRVSRYEVLSIAAYSVPQVVLDQVSVPPEAPPLVEFETFHNGARTVMATGWVVAFDKDRLQVLDRMGNEVIVPREQIWGLKPQAVTGQLVFPRQADRPTTYWFRHPLAFESYPEAKFPRDGKNTVPLIPHLIFFDPIAVKEHFDRIEKEYTLIQEYSDRQRFYARPFYFGPNRTYLGTWAMAGSRYVNVGARRSNFLPFVQSQGASGPFLFQYEVASGVLPRRWGLHGEPQPQASFAMKDAYLAFEAFFDPTFALIGSRYNWQKENLDSVDVRVNETGGVRMGIDWKHVGFGLGTSLTDLALRIGDDFSSDSKLVTWGYLSFVWDMQTLELGYASSHFNSQPTQNLSALNVRFETDLPGDASLMVRYIYRKTSGADSAYGSISSVSHEIAPYLSVHIANRWRLTALCGLESVELHGKSADRNPPKPEQNETKFIPKAGAGAALFF